MPLRWLLGERGLANRNRNTIRDKLLSSPKIEPKKVYESVEPVNHWLNDVFGARIILTADEIKTLMDLLDNWQDELA